MSVLDKTIRGENALRKGKGNPEQGEQRTGGNKIF